MRTDRLALSRGATYSLSAVLVQAVELPPEFGTWDEWLAVLSVRCGWALALCIPPK